MDLKNIYELRKSFTIIGLTGRTGSGCSDVAELLKSGFIESKYIEPLKISSDNTDRKYKIVYKYAKENFKEYFLIEYKYVISLYIFSQPLDFVKNYLLGHFEELNLENLVFLEDCFEKTFDVLREFDFYNPKTIAVENISKLYDIFTSDFFLDSAKCFQDSLNNISPVLRIKVMQLLSNNVRESGCAICKDSVGLINVYNIVTIINKLIKGHKQKHTICKIVIDSLRNPLEIMYLKERYSAFYMMNVNSEEQDINERLLNRYNRDLEIVNKILEIDKNEYKSDDNKEFFKQNVSECIQKSDIHISNITEQKVIEFNTQNTEAHNNTSPKFSLEKQLLKYISLIEQPGIITPSPEERSMQIAYTAKYNSGCISRQVGAVITDENYSIKAVGWNNTPEGHTPCLLRSSDDLLDDEGDKSAFSEYEKTNQEFYTVFQAEYKNIDKTNLQGRNIPFCFKCIQNSIKEGKNQVHTRSLHAEESAFLQISKYGGQGIKGGKLFTTASPCELCAKKAYQLGIEVIYYIDLYPGISIDHILKTGSYPKEIRLFHGAIGNAYHKLYSPFMAYKDELSLITGVDFPDYATKLKKINSELEIENTKLREEIKKQNEQRKH